MEKRFLDSKVFNSLERPQYTYGCSFSSITSAFKYFGVETNQKEVADEIGYDIVDDIRKYAMIDSSDFGVPQARKRLIILGVRRDITDCDKFKSNIMIDKYIDIYDR
jgi:site-specific DNA-cytosine methylase